MCPSMSTKLVTATFAMAVVRFHVTCVWVAWASVCIIQVACGAVEKERSHARHTMVLELENNKVI